MSEYQWDFGSAASGLQFKVVYDSAGTFTVTCISGSMDLNALWFANDDKSDGTVTLAKSENSLNMNGTGITWDDFYKVSCTGLGSEGVNKTSYLSGGESMSFSLATLDLTSAILSLLDDPTKLTVGVRATSTSSINGDGKFVDIGGTLITSVNHAPTLDTVTNGAVNDSAKDDTYPDVTGTLHGNDSDGDVVSFELAGAVAASGTGISQGFNVQKSSDYGIFYLNTTSGAYKFVADDAAVESLTSTQTLKFVVNATDGAADSDPQSITISLNGAEDAPEVTAVVAKYTDTVADNTFDDTLGTLEVSSRDGDTSFTFALDGSSVTGQQDYNLQKTGAYGTLYLNSSTGAYKFVANDAAIEALEGSDHPSDVFHVTAAADGATSPSQTITINLQGAEDAPEITAVVAKYTDTVADNTFDDTLGTLEVSSRDGDTSFTFALDGSSVTGQQDYNLQKTGTYGTLYLNSSTGTYKFVANDAAIEALEGGDHPSDVFHVTAAADGATSPSQTITINLQGAEDAPEVTAVVAEYADTAIDDTFDATLGTLEVNSRDGDTTFTFALESSSSTGNLDYDLQNTSSGYGILYLNSSTGAYKFVANDDAIEALQWGTNPSLEYHVTAEADGVTSDSQTITINITGANDAPRDLTLTAESNFATGNGIPDTGDKIGTLSVPAGADPDAGGTYTYSLDSATVGNLGAPSNFTNANGQFAVSAAGVLSAAEALTAGHIYEVTVNVSQGEEGALATYSETFSIVTGTNATTENLPGSGYDFSSGDDVIYGRQNVDIILAGSGNDTVFGQEGNDEIHGGAGVDLLNGGKDNDTLFGEDGNDTLFGEDGSDEIHGGIGADLLNGGKDSDTLFGEDGDDTLFGEDGSDEIHGGTGADLLYGGKDSDTLFGEDGNDEIHGNAGADQLYGGNGNDSFVFSSGDTGINLANADIIGDFSSADDTIVTSLAAGNVTIVDGTALANFNAFVAAANAVLTSGHSTNDAYMAWNAAGSGNGWLVVDENDSGSVDNGDSLIVLVGVNTAGEFATTDIA